jgi:hypothetical protein
MDETRNAYRSLIENSKEREHLEGLGDNNKVVLKEQAAMTLTRFIWLRIGTRGGLL